MMTQDLRFIGYNCGFGAGNEDTQDGPDVIFESSHFQALRKRYGFRPPKMVAETSKKRHSPQDIKNFHAVMENLRSLRDVTSQAVLKGDIPMTIGGDHSQGLGSAAGVKQALGKSSELGLIWIDAHLDAHTPETSPSANAHGMPLASLMGVGPKDFTELAETGNQPIINPDNVVIIGARSFEPEEAELLGRLGVHIYHATDVKARGFKNIFHEAIRSVSDRSSHFGISLDMDAFDPRYAPGVGTPAGEGLNPADVISELAHAMTLKKATWMDISEFNPHLDDQDKTLGLIFDILYAIAEKNGSEHGVRKHA